MPDRCDIFWYIPCTLHRNVVRLVAFCFRNFIHAFITCHWVCVSVKSHLTGASVHPENDVAYTAGNDGQKNLWGFA